MSSTERHLARIEYENALRGLKSKKNLEMDEAVNSLDVFLSILHHSLLLNSEDSLHQNSVGSDWFVYRVEDNNPQEMRVLIRSTDKKPVQEIDFFCKDNRAIYPDDSGYRAAFRLCEIIPGVYYENFPIISIPMSEIAEGIEPDGEWVSHTKNGVTMFKQYPWQARTLLGGVLIETNPDGFTQTERKYSEKYRHAISYTPFWRGKIENEVFVPEWNQSLMSDFYKQVSWYANTIKPILFGK